jgi:CBS domain-containing protein
MAEAKDVSGHPPRMTSQLTRRGQRSFAAAAGATFFLLLGLGVVWFARKIAGINDGAVLSVLVIIPALLYVVLRGDLSELRGPGGWGATFRVTKATVNFGAQSLDTIGDPQLLAKDSLSGLDSRIQALDRDQPVLMTVTLGEHYTVTAMTTYLDNLARLPRFNLVAFLDRSGGFIGCASPTVLLSLMQDTGLGTGFLRAVEDGNAANVFRYPGILNNVIPAETTNSQALEAMSRHGLSALAVVGDDRRVKGVVEREQLMSKLVLSLIDDATRDRR